MSAKDLESLDHEPLARHAQEGWDLAAKLRAEVERLKDAHGQGELNERLKDPVEYAKVAIAGCALKIEELELQYGRLLKAANDLLGKMGGPDTPINPIWEDEFIELDVLLGEIHQSNEARSDGQHWCTPTTAGLPTDNPAIIPGPRSNCKRCR